MFKKPVVNKKRAAKNKKLYVKPTKQLAVVAARRKVHLEAMREDTRVLKLAKAGHTFEEVAKIITAENEKHGEPGISTNEALRLTKDAINRWVGELALDAVQAKELDLKRIDALMVILMEQIEPKPVVDQWGFPILDAATGKPVMTLPDYVAIKLYKDLLERRARMLGLDAEESSVKVNIENNIIERRYIGASPDDL